VNAECPGPDCPLRDGQMRQFDEEAGAQMECFVQDFRRMYRERNEALREVTRAHKSALLQLSLAAEKKDDDTGVHIVRMGYLAEALALFLGQSPAYASMLRQAAPMHDIGKIGIPDSVLKKPGPLTDEERQVMNTHPAMGAEILGRSHIPVFLMASELALTHHERYDGSGYPAGLVGDAIPLSGRITAVVDFFDALTMDRVYRPAFTVERALSMLVAESGAAFDPLVVNAFLAHAEEIDALRCRITRERPSFDALIDSL
jgi:putative two-component system response regulator